MRLLFVTSALASHHFTMVPLAWSALAAGHSVQILTSPDLAPVTARSGLPVHTAGPAVDFERLHRDMVGRVARGELRYDPKLLFCRVADAMADEAVAVARAWRPDVVVWDPAAFAGPLAAAVTGALSVRCLWGVDILGRGATLVERLPAAFHELFGRFGQEVPEDPDWWTVDPCPPSIVPDSQRHRRLPVRYVPYSPNGDVPAELFVRGGRARVCLTFGSGIAMREFVTGPDFAASALLQGLRELDAELLLAVSAADRAALGALPDSVRVVSSCPLGTLLPTCDAVVHHGGDGTLFTSALSGVPQLAIPYLPDLRFGSARFAQTGAVRTIEADELSGLLARSHVLDLLQGQECRTSAARLREDMLAQPAPGEVVARLENLAAGRAA
ncbi:nucleotide disphospho-sugar-binding domain-containing protein [Streptomyces rimosus]|uniref:nucleotide disphospho-sugar-binding domain-containing protein n=1 Tax=Streptomyces rimosus TaxID=1927 RepID=UPI0004C02872|nr:nucleotide disphospho-sugar-binding domain-containing protein [Streptomyces rimosus]